MLISSFQIYFSYSQFVIFDEASKNVGLDWSDRHFSQGFARTDSAVSFRTLFQFGSADVKIFYAVFKRQGDEERVISVPFHSMSEHACLFAPEEDEPLRFDIEPGDYLLTSAQVPCGAEESLLIRLYFEKF